ncbi:Type 1 glutamine amidotransferase-like domain-containing protein [Paenibacillus alkalitolerans]|uniref:Type 1 glutamine amidotransferase-like domain-containing protein n=1 Tax=Paenibacillus alkalitolerans TaxID=2799335 RepID=UPI0018F56085|nr:Type 1 glutamine amidotransferase-like domain-containing protein [Paenibacillus alkalitolerans]
MFDYDAIHLSGGNTFYFLSLLKKRNTMEMLRAYVNKGGILIGVSAGSILMTKTIGFAGYGVDGDRNVVYVDFEFLPHWDGSEETVNIRVIE